MGGVRTNTVLNRYYKALLAHFGPQRWWPASTRFEVVVGAILTQNTAWTNVARALTALRDAGLLNKDGIRSTSELELGRLIRSSGYWRQKAKTLKRFVTFLDENYRGSLQHMFVESTETLRRQLLSIPGIGPETADSILLYAGGRPSFIADAYARRILERHQLLDDNRPAQATRRTGTRRQSDYNRVRDWFQAHLPPDPALYNEFHALIVETGKRYCWKLEPNCVDCPLRRFLPAASKFAHE